MNIAWSDFTRNTDVREASPRKHGTPTPPENETMYKLHRSLEWYIRSCRWRWSDPLIHSRHNGEV